MPELDRKGLFELLKGLHSPGESEASARPLRYVIYARKSTDDPQKQVRSLADQIQECKDLAESRGLRCVEIIQEAKSAKEPDIRTEFRRMIEGLKTGKYDGIIAWHPDRLARNMKDAGEVIDLLDKNVIQDLQFVSFTFDNTVSGKMTLGITFVLSKEYSDKLSENIDRGNRRSLEEGKYVNKPKHGYRKDREAYLRPDGNNYLLIRQAFKMRLEGAPQKEIAEYLNQSGYTKMRRDPKDGVMRHFVHKMDKNKVSAFLNDPVYVGILVYGNRVLDLVELYGFEPMVSVQEFMQINKLNKKQQLFKLARKHRRANERIADLMNDMVLCAKCGQETTPGITRKEKQQKSYFYYRCDTDDCERRGKSTRAKVVMEYAAGFLDTKPFSNEESYKHYEAEMKRVSEERLIQERSLLQSLQHQLRKQDEKILNIRETIYSNDPDLKEMAKADMKVAERRKAELEGLVEQKRAYIAKGKASILTYQEFIELMDNMGQTLRSLRSMKDMDFLMRKIFLNFSVDGKNVANATLSSPFEELYTLYGTKGGPYRIRTCDPCFAKAVLYQLS